MGKKILLADDSITIQKVIELTFSDEDFEVVTVGNGRLAVERIQEVRPDIVLCDVIMPEKDGYEVCDFVKKTPGLSHIPVLLLTGAFEPFDQDKAARVKSDGSLAKPFEPQALINKVKELLARAASAPAAAPPAPPPAVATVPAPPPATVPAPPPATVPAPPPPAPSTATVAPGAMPPPSAAPVPEPAPPTASNVTASFTQPLTIPVIPPSPPAPPEPPAPVEPEVEEAAFIPDDEPVAATAPASPSAAAPTATSPEIDEGLGMVGEPVESPVDEAVAVTPADEGDELPVESPGVGAGKTWLQTTVEVPLEARAQAGRQSPAVFEEVFEEVPDVVEATPEPEPEPEPEAEPEPAFVAEPEPPSSAVEAPEPEEAALLDFGEPGPVAEASAPEVPAPPPPPTPAPPPAPAPAPLPAIVAAPAMAAPPPVTPPSPPPAPVVAASEPVHEFEEASFADMSAAEEPVSAPAAPSEAAEVAVPMDMVEKIAQRVVAHISEKVVREIAWEVVPDLAEALIKQEIERLKAELKNL